MLAMSTFKAAETVRPDPRAIDDDPRLALKPLNPPLGHPFDLPGVPPLLRVEPVVDAIIDPTVQAPEYRIDVRRVELAQPIICGEVPLGIVELARRTPKGPHLVCNRVARGGGPPDVHVVVDPELDQCTELPKGQPSQVRGVLVLGVPPAHPAPEEFVGLQRAKPSLERYELRYRPGVRAQVWVLVSDPRLWDFPPLDGRF